MPKASLVSTDTARRRTARAAVVSLAVHAALVGVAVVVSASVAAQHVRRRVKLTFYDTPEPEKQAPQAEPPPAQAPAAPPPPPRRVFVRKMAPPPDLPPPPEPQEAAPTEPLLVAPAECTDPNGCNQNPGAPGGVEGGTGVPGGVPGGTGTVPAKAPERPRPMYLSPEMTRPRLLSGDQPRYTEQARRARVEGDVTVRIEVGADGRVGEIRILSGLALLDQEVVSKIRNWRFSPPTYRGQRVSVYLIQRITFRLED